MAIDGKLWVITLGLCLPLAPLLMSKPQSLRTKLIFLVVAAVGATTTVATAISVWQQVSSYSAMRRQALIATAQVLAAAAGSATAERNELE
ncbi:MAG: hypothetical protein ACXWJW_03965, partial [Xanthobacteraceae bacterium]